ncbi:thioesterase II family protein [Streptomyces sp. NPDC059538]|uniref:thioesterase II family protein n=1 Tax=Streptomyces sp. NPDC059538 TaxID=3346860 RepID=UPI00368CB705
MTRGTWLRRLSRGAGPRARLVCFPHAGGTASFFRSWAPSVPSDVELHAVRYPGREDRLLEEPATTMRELVEPIARDCLPLLDRPLVLFGHSMGASIAHEVAVVLETRYGVPPASLVVSSQPGPGHVPPEGSRAQQGDAELIESIGLLGGTEAAALQDPELRELVLPAIRADYRLIEQYWASPHTLTGVSAPVVVYHGNADPGVGRDAVEAWSTVARSTFDTRCFEGGHFYLVDHAQEVLDDLFARLDLTPRTVEPAPTEDMP